MIYQVDPLSDRRWGELVWRHPNSSIFHTSRWLEALQRTYGYKPVVYTASHPRGELTNGLAFCRVSSRLTGERLVSLPFSDHCDPLLEKAGKSSGGAALFSELHREQSKQRLKYVELRPKSGFPDLQPNMDLSHTYCLHVVDLSPIMEDLYASFHASCTKEKIRRAEREKLILRKGRSLELLKIFYYLLVKTRRRHRVPPQPFAWFQNLAECLGPAMQIKVALAGGVPAAGMVTLQFRDVLVVKYSGSDSRRQNLGGMQWLYWKVIQEARGLGSKKLDLGRSDWDNQGLITFKDRLGARRFPISYWRYPKSAAQSCLKDVFRRPAGWVLGHTPLSMASLVGRTLYRHIG